MYLRAQFLFVWLVLQSISLYSMEYQLSVEEHSSPASLGIILLSNDNKEFIVNEEAVGNSVLLQKHKECNNKKVPMQYNSEVVSFLATVLNDPLRQDDLLRSKINELQEENNNTTASLAQYAAALKEFDIFIWKVVQKLPKAPVCMQMSIPNRDMSNQGTVEYQGPEDSGDQGVQSHFIVNQSSCCRRWQCCPELRTGDSRCNPQVCCSFSIVKKFKNCFFCCIPFFCLENQDDCYIGFVQPM